MTQAKALPSEEELIDLIKQHQRPSFTNYTDLAKAILARFGMAGVILKIHKEVGMKKIEDGESAFPVQGNPLNIVGTKGVTLLDYFAGQALSGLLSEQGRFGDIANRGGYAKCSYEIAETMIKARSEHGK